jgi:GNAT superfamily N-acetyltransferase
MLKAITTVIGRSSRGLRKSCGRQLRSFSGMGDAEAMQRIDAFEAGVDDDVAEEVRGWEYGTVVMSASMPQVWDANYFRVAGDTVAPVEDLVAAATTVAAGAGLKHVSFIVGESQGNRLWAGLEPLGYDRTRFLYLALRGRPDVPAHEVVEVGAEDVVASRAEGTLEFFPGNTELVAQLAELDRRLARTIGGRWFAIREDGDVISRAWLLQAAGIGQVEDVATTPAKRGLGYARAVVSAAALASLEAGNDLTFIVADADDSVTDLYRSIGFEPLGHAERFVRSLRLTRTSR